jgi:hypothetical protein
VILTMEPIALLSRAEFEELRNACLENDHQADAPSLTDALEIIRRGVSAMLEKTPLDDLKPGLRGELATFVDVATWALTMDRATKEAPRRPPQSS